MFHIHHHARKALCLLALLSIIGFVATDSHAQTNVTYDGYKIKVNGSDFAFKGVNYSPVPIGTNPGAAPYGDYFTPTYFNVWNSDIETMRSMGVNTIKLYAGNPGLNAGAPGSGGNWNRALGSRRQWRQGRQRRQYF